MNNFDLIAFSIENGVKVSIKPCNVDVTDPDTVGVELKISNLNKTISIKRTINVPISEKEDTKTTINAAVDEALNKMLEEIRNVNSKVEIAEPKTEE